MLDLLVLYWPTILAAVFLGSTLAVIGALLVTREAAVQTLAVSQGAGLGVSIGLLLSQIFFSDSHLEHTVLPLLFGLLFSALAYSLTEWISRRSHSRTVVYLAAYGGLWAASQLLTGFFPVIEGHATALFFGDVVTLTRGESFFFFCLSLAAAAYLALFGRRLALRSFFSTILSEPMRLKSPLDLGFYLVSLVMVCLSVQFLGLLFTLVCLFVPTAIYSFSGRVGARRHLGRVAVSASLASGIGFAWSLAESRLLTTPLIGLLLIALPLLHICLEKLLFRCN